MRAAKHNPAFRKKMGIPLSVAKDFVAADKGRDISKLPTRVRNNHKIGA
jgi:hypothetical protein